MDLTAGQEEGYEDVEVDMWTQWVKMGMDELGDWD